ncbi:MAG: hypothetical protein M3Q58_12430 [Bacteroidota bacterium]|nr:hypothetical protein [Bacteroidota bacterium]
MSPIFCSAQEKNGQDCLNLIMQLENQINTKKDKEQNKATFIHYSTRVQDWDNVFVSSEVKIIQHNKKVHFFSDKANVFQDGKDVLLVLHDQRIVIWNSTPESINESVKDDFLLLKEAFFQSCEIIHCKTNKDNEQERTLILKAPEADGLISIEKLTYVFNEKEQKILKVIVEYNKEYKVRKMNITYHQMNLEYSYNFNKTAWKNVLDNNYRPTGKYTGYNLIDNREK